jgi:hypothetical protein
MTNKRLTWLILAIVLIFGMTLVSCGETGGTITFDNRDNSGSWSVSVSRSSIRPSSSTTVPAYSSRSMSFEDDGYYYAYGYFGSGWRYERVYLSGGNTVILRTRSDFSNSTY